MPHPRDLHSEHILHPRHGTQPARDGLARRAKHTLHTLHLDAAPEVRFFGANRRPEFRAVALPTYDEAYRISQVIGIARGHIGRGVPRVWLDWLEDNIVVTEFVPGRVAPSFGPVRLARAARLLARLHNVQVAHRRDLGPMRSCFTDRLDPLVSAAFRVETADRPDGFRLWLARYHRLKRRRWPRTLMHGDTHEENFIWSRDGRPTLIDWDLSQAGAPHFDLAYLLLWRGYTLIEQRRFGGWLRTIETVLAAYNHSARRGRIAMKDLLSWIGCLALGYLGYGAEIEADRYLEAAARVWDALEELAWEHGAPLR